MKIIYSLVVFTVAFTARAADLSFEGKGTLVDPDTKRSSYTTTLEKTVKSKDCVEVVGSVTYRNDKGKEVTRQWTYTIQANRAQRFDVLVKGKKAGWGHYVEEGNNKWYDMHLEVEGEKIHINGYYDVDTNQVYQMGDMENKRGVFTFSEKLELQ